MRTQHTTGPGYQLTISGRSNGTVGGGYVRINRTKVRRTREIVEDLLLADYDSRGELVGIEILGPVKLSALADLVDATRRPSFRKFLKRTAPKELVVA